MTAMASSATCTQHPSRPADTPCVRCGAFICDWCVKLAPSWGPGLCLDCQKRTGASTPKLPLSRGFMIVGAAVLISPFFTWNEIVETKRLGPEVPPVVSGVVIAVLVILLVWNIGALALVALRRPQARLALLGFFAVRGVVAALGALASTGVAAWLPVALNLALFVYVGWSDDARVMFGPPPETSAADALKGDPD